MTWGPQHAQRQLNPLLMVLSSKESRLRYCRWFDLDPADDANIPMSDVTPDLTVRTP